MVVGILQFELLIPSATSLKDKRRVVRSVKDRLHREHQVSVAEVGSQELLNVAILGASLVSADGAKVGRTLDSIVSKMRCLRGAELGGTSRQVTEVSVMSPSKEMGESEREELSRELLGMMEEERT
jgi:uncharacterized protein YlxP (DUF503 family)